ncbi:RnfABCDGE type electron transport complex subunit B [Sporobacter termitidis]|uniref:RnfABCDGE type electron transport complex subunit B n=1 Tax=Sporobacter termitidis TaxID=44749 RepID=UPI0009339C79|nr:Fe-S cluster domain-containing protein [Sporobacter termitidis]
MFFAIVIVIVLAAIGLVFGLVLAVANKKLKVETNPLIEEVEELLPKGQCGACGYAGCAAYAEAVVLNPDVAPNLCVPGKQEVADAVSQLTGKTAEKVEPHIAHVRCAGSCDKAKIDYTYTGVKDCGAANMLHYGPKACKYGCLGFGSCVSACNFGALSLGDNGLPAVDAKKCTGCGACEKACPKKLIKMQPTAAHVKVDCSSRDKGAAAKKNCVAACIGCGLCAKNCPYQAVRIQDNLAFVDAAICIEKCAEATCVGKCPTGAISALAGFETEKVLAKAN